MSKIKILIVDDHEVVRKGIKALLEDEESLEIVGEAGNGITALDCVAQLQPDIVLLDINMPEMNGIEAAKIISQKHSKSKVLVFSMHNNEDYILKSIENGVKGYLLKDSDKEVILKAIETIHKGGKYFPTNVSSILVGAIQTKKTERKKKTIVVGNLSKKEIEILKLISSGMKSKEIAEKLDLSIRTVSNHRANMLRKTSLTNTAELIRIASEEGI